ncbi:MAG: hypothetical protein ACR2KK_06830 [Acidimicrobiales bacterium]
MGADREGHVLRFAVALALIALATAACGDSPSDAGLASSQSTPTTSTTVVESTTTSTDERRTATTSPASRATAVAPSTQSTRSVTPTTGTGLTAEEDRRINPPPPQNVRVTGVAVGRVSLAWDEPPAVTGPRTYSDVVIGYRVYRRAPGAVEFQPVGTSTARTYVDDTVRSGQYSYQVSSIRERDLEGTRSDPVLATVP